MGAWLRLRFRPGSGLPLPPWLGFAVARALGCPPPGAPSTSGSVSPSLKGSGLPLSRGLTPPPPSPHPLGGAGGALRVRWGLWGWWCFRGVSAPLDTIRNNSNIFGLVSLCRSAPTPSPWGFPPPSRARASLPPWLGFAPQIPTRWGVGFSLLVSGQCCYFNSFSTVFPKYGN